MRSYRTLLSELVLAAVFAGFCTAAGSAQTDQSQPAGPAPAKPADSNSDVAVTVNGYQITEAQVQTAMKPQMDRLQASGAKLPVMLLKQMMDSLRQRVLDSLIVQHLLDEQVEKANIQVTDADVIAHLKEIGAQQTPPMSLDDIKQLLEQQGRSFEQLKLQIKTSKGLKYKKLMDGQFAGKIDVNDKEVLDYYQNNKDKFRTPEQVKASHILITPDTSDPNVDPNQAKARARAKAEDLLKQIKSGNADFATLARQYSACPSAQRGGDLGFFKRGTMVPAFEKAAFALKPGQVSDVVETKFGYHIIKVTDRKAATEQTFEQVKDQILKDLQQQKKRRIAEKYVEDLKAKADIVYPPGKEQAAAPPAVSVTGPNTTAKPR